MAINKIIEDVYSVGVLNPNLRVFDIVMETQYGTSYNSYIVKGSTHTALVETTHLTFFDVYLENLREVIEIEKIDYLIMNHNEPDHSGAIHELLKLAPDLKIVVSQAGAVYLKNIVNENKINFHIVKDGDTIDLGGKTLSFINAPFLHWPDSMFTYMPEDNLLFTCDFFGSHYCETRVVDKYMVKKFKPAYEDALKNYYDAIFGPFKPFVLKGIEKIKNLEIEYVCPSHGPVLTKGCLLESVMEKYIKWSTPISRKNKVVPLFYCSAYGNTEILANAIAAGIKMTIPTAAVNCYDLNDYSIGDMATLLNSSDAFLLGSPTINKDAVPPIWQLLCHIDAINIVKRPTAIFGSYGWSGESFKNLRGRLEGVKANVYEEDFKVLLVPTKEDLVSATEYGKKFAEQIQ